MNRNRMFKIMNKASSTTIKEIAKVISKKYSITIIKEPVKTLTMIKVREPVKSSLFYLGEVIVTTTVVELDSVKGMAILMGDDLDKVLDMAIIDAAYNKKIEELESIFTKLIKIESEQIEQIEKENALYHKTKVDFKSMTKEEPL